MVGRLQQLVIQEALDKNKWSVNDLDILIPHQANLRISQFIQKKFKLNKDQVYNNIIFFLSYQSFASMFGLTNLKQALKKSLLKFSFLISSLLSSSTISSKVLQKLYKAEHLLNVFLDKKKLAQ